MALFSSLQSAFSKAPTKTAVSFAASLGVDGVGVVIDGHTILRDISFDVAPGEIIAILGASGSGKSTLLQVIAGLLAPSVGNVKINDNIVSTNGVIALQPEKRGVGLIFQDYMLFPHMRVLDNVAFGLEKNGRKAAREEALRFLERVRLAHKADAFPHQLSGGEQQRVALARAVAPRPQILLMDEPFSGLDTTLRADVRETTFHVLKEARITTLCVTHDAMEALEIADRVCVMADGKILQIAPPDTLYHHPASPVVASLFGKMNSYVSRLEGGVISLPFGSHHVSGFLEGCAVHALVRARDVHLVDHDSAAYNPYAGHDAYYEGAGQILSRQFFGDRTRYRVGINNSTSQILADCDGLPAHVQKGDSVHFYIPKARVHVFGV